MAALKVVCRPLPQTTPQWLCVITKLEYDRPGRVHCAAVVTERSGEENPLGLHAKAGPDVSCAALDCA